MHMRAGKELTGEIFEGDRKVLCTQQPQYPLESLNPAGHTNLVKS